MSKIKSIKARQILDSRGNPTVEVDLFTESNHMGRASVPSGASTGSREALELRDGDKSVFMGKSVYKAIANINEKIAPKVIGMDSLDLRAIDKVMLEIDGTDFKNNLGANAMLAVSMAAFEPRHYESGVKAVLSLIDILPSFPVSDDENFATILNANVPDLPWEQIKGFKTTRLGKRHISQNVVEDKEGRGKDIYWLGAVGDIADKQEGTDFHATEHGYISVTSIHIDVTQYQMIESTRDWLSNSNINTHFSTKSGEVC